ncbi:MAG: glycogen/starch/alpha-glucan phosphorylase [Kiritimatiellae bacterium]|nr:glycogen/starch/alpha-glucan phosphorylase [Kiritimatiellia bacterium]
MENCRKIFPIIGKTGPDFPTIGKKLSNHWKTRLFTTSQQIARPPCCTTTSRSSECTNTSANVEIREEVGADNFFLFGKTVEEVEALRRAGYNPWDVYNNNPDVRRVLDAIRDNFFNLDQPGLYQPIWDTLLTHGDHFLVLDEFAAYVAKQAEIAKVYEQPDRWSRMCLMNIANSGKFSTDRTIAEYAKEIWHITPCPVA